MSNRYHKSNLLNLLTAFVFGSYVSTLGLNVWPRIPLPDDVLKPAPEQTSEKAQTALANAEAKRQRRQARNLALVANGGWK